VSFRKARRPSLPKMREVKVEYTERESSPSYSIYSKERRSSVEEYNRTSGTGTLNNRVSGNFPPSIRESAELD